MVTAIFIVKAAPLDTLVCHGALTVGPARLTQTFFGIANRKIADFNRGLNWRDRLGADHVSVRFADVEVRALHDTLLTLNTLLGIHIHRVILGCKERIVSRLCRLR